MIENILIAIEIKIMYNTVLYHCLFIYDLHEKHQHSNFITLE